MVGTAGGDPGSTDWRSGASLPTGTRRAARSPSCPWSLRTNYGRVNHKAVYARAASSPATDWRNTSSTSTTSADRRGVEQLIGRSAYAVLVLNERPPFLRSFLHCLDALDAMDGMRPTAAPSRRRGDGALVSVPYRTA